MAKVWVIKDFELLISSILYGGFNIQMRDTWAEVGMMPIV